MTEIQAKIYLNALLSEISICPDLPSIEHVQIEVSKRAEYLAAGGLTARQFDAPCSSIFEFLNIEHKSAPSWFLPKNATGIDPSLFPIKSDADTSNKKNGQLTAGFQIDFEKLPAEAIIRAESVLMLLQKYGSNLPSGYHPDVSLYDFAKIKAALAVCLHENPSEKLLLIGGSVSGVQTFLYDIVSKNAAKNLKGRSFYLHLLADSAVFGLLKKLELPRANVIYASGGSFFLLAPDAEKTRTAFYSWKKETLDWFFHKHNLRLFLETDFVEFEAEQLLKNDLPAIFKKLHDKLGDDKKNPFAEQLAENFGDIFEPHGDGGETSRDAITGDELKPNDKVRLDDAPDGSPVFVSKLNNDIQKLGKVLRETEFWVTSHEPLAEKGLHSIEQSGVFHTLFESKPNFDLPSGSLLRQFNELKSEDSEVACGFEFYGGNDQPVVRRPDGFFAPKSFSELANVPDEEEGYFEGHELQKLEFSRLAVLRMDVDGLGKIFRDGLPTLAHYSTLSRSLDWFFKGHLNYIWEKEAFEIEIENGRETQTHRSAFKDWTEFLYAGGDDLFLVGRWDCLLDFSFKIQQAFHQYVCENERLGLSGGISLVTHKFPIMKAADQAGAAESKAKRHEKEIEGKPGEFHFKKNSFTLLGRALHWQAEFEIVKSLKERLVEARRMPSKPLPQSVLMKIAAFHEQKEMQEKLKEPPSWKWRIAYDLTRARERVRGNPQVSALIDELTVSIFTNRYIFEKDSERATRAHEFFDLLMVAIRWAELELRHRRALEKSDTIKT